MRRWGHAVVVAATREAVPASASTSNSARLPWRAAVPGWVRDRLAGPSAGRMRERRAERGRPGCRDYSETDAHAFVSGERMQPMSWG